MGASGPGSTPDSMGLTASAPYRPEDAELAIAVRVLTELAEALAAESRGASA